MENGFKKPIVRNWPIVYDHLYITYVSITLWANISTLIPRP